jgi:hypothetical protein
MDEFGNCFPLNAWKPTQATYHDAHKHNWKPLYTSPPAQPDAAPQVVNGGRTLTTAECVQARIAPQEAQEKV